MLNACASFWEHFVGRCWVGNTVKERKHTHTHTAKLHAVVVVVVVPRSLARSIAARFNFPQWMKIFHGKVVVAVPVAVVLFCRLREQRGGVERVK